MDNDQGTLTIWQSGRLAPRVAAPRFEFGRNQAIAVALLVLSALVLAAYVAVLERDVDGSELAHQMQRARAQAEAQCEADRPMQLRGRCIALLNGDEVAAQAAPPQAPEDTPAQDNAERAATVSLLAKR
jgi:hypothetical protein